MLPLPKEPKDARSFKFEIKSSDTPQKDSFEILHPAEMEGKNAYLSSGGNFDEPS